MTEISVYLFSKPENEIDLEKAKPEDLRKLDDEMQKSWKITDGKDVQASMT